MGKKRQSGFTKQGVRDLNTPTEKQQALQKTREQLLRGAQCPTCRGKGWRWAATWGWDGWEECDDCEQTGFKPPGLHAKRGQPRD